jgi:DNA-directed RNA polymerase subunit beta
MKGRIEKNKGIFYVSSEQEKRFTIAPSDIFKSCGSYLLKSDNICGVKKNQNFFYRLANNIDFISTSTDQFTSIGTGLIPFLEHDDANRVLMGSNMQRQALSLVDKEASFIETGREILINRESDSTIVSKNSGRVIYSSIKKIIIEEQFGLFEFRNRNLFRSSSSIRLFKKLTENSKVDKIIRREQYYLGVPKNSNHGIYLRRNPVVQEGEWVKKGQILADGISTLNGTLCLGKNILIAYLGWEGYNFEDAVIINERLVNEDVFTSLHMKKFKTFISADEESDV